MELIEIGLRLRFFRIPIVQGDACFGKSHGCAFGSAEVRDRLDDLLGLDAGAILCRTIRDTLLRRDYYNRHIWKPAIAAAGLSGDTTFHDLRHYADGWVMRPAVTFPLLGAAELVLQSA